jgi:hypothetical protein
MAGSGSRIYLLTFSYLSSAMVPVPILEPKLWVVRCRAGLPSLSASSATSSSGLTNTVESVIRLACACAATGSMRATLRTWCARVDADAAFPTLAEWQLDRIPRAN